MNLRDLPLGSLIVRDGLARPDDVRLALIEAQETDRRLGELMGVDRTTVNHYRTGRRRWSARFEARLNAAVASLTCDTTPRAGAGCDGELPAGGVRGDTTLPESLDTERAVAQEI